MRILLSETVDPDGAMCRWMSPDLESLGHQVVVVPTQEAIHRLGVSGYQLLLMELTERWQPDLIVVHPPYDYLNQQTCAQLRRGGARLVTFAFDDDIFLDDWRSLAVWDTLVEALGQMADLVLTTSTRAATAGGETVRSIRWAMSPPTYPQPGPEPLQPAPVVLVGRAYARRVALVRRLAAAHLPVWVRGHGWEHQKALGATVNAGGGVDTDTMWALYRRAGVVLTTGGWEGRHVPMVKVRVLETALAGACQVVAWSPDLERYFTPDEVPSYRTEEALIAHLSELLTDPDASTLARPAAA
ncbi:MAG: glycosyltransferase [Myxococcota bacterium]